HVVGELADALRLFLALRARRKRARRAAAAATAARAAPSSSAAGSARGAGARRGPVRHPVRAEADLTRDLTLLPIEHPTARDVRRVLRAKRREADTRRNRDDDESGARSCCCHTCPGSYASTASLGNCRAARRDLLEELSGTYHRTRSHSKIASVAKT